VSDRFTHHRLDVYHLSLELAVAGKGIADAIPRGYRSLADQLIRSAPAVVLLVAEGANRSTPKQKHQRFVEARGECGEAAATVELATRMGFVSSEQAAPFLELADRVAAMLTRLIVRFE